MFRYLLVDHAVPAMWRSLAAARLSADWPSGNAPTTRVRHRAFALLDPLLASPALVVERNDALGRAAHVRHDEADARIKFFGMPLDLGDNPPRLAPASGLIAEARMTSAHMVRGSSDRTLEQIADPVLKDPVGRQADRIFDPLGFQKLVDLRHGERCGSAEIDTRQLALGACNDRLEHAVPAVGAVHVAGTQGAAFEITELVENEQRVIAGAGVMPVPDAHLLLAMGRAHARIHVEHDASRRAATVHKVDPPARQIGNSREVLGCREPLRLEAAHLAR